MNNSQKIELIANSIRTIKNWPIDGVMFRDITTLLLDHKAFSSTIDIFCDRYRNQKIDLIAGLDARGFIFGPVVAYQMNLGFVPIRKSGKLPYNSISETYTVEYNEQSTVEIHTDAVLPGQNVVIIDDLIATGGTMIAACNLINRLKGNVVECAVVSDLEYLNGSKIIREKGFNVYSIIQFQS